MVSSRNILRKQKTQQRVYPEKKAVQLPTNQGELSMYPAQTKGRSHLSQNCLSIKEQLLKGDYKPQPVRRVEITKPCGGKRLLGITTVIDRLIQQAYSI